MTIIAVADFTSRKERGWDHPGYPIGTWQAEGQVVGDASGGTRIVQMDLAKAFTPPGLAFSLEWLTAADLAGIANVMRLAIIAFDADFASTRNYVFPLTVASGVTSAFSVGTRDLPRPIFLGISASAIAAAVLSWSLANLNTEVLTVHAGGYFWNPRSVAQLPGGYLRPPDGMFGT